MVYWNKAKSQNIPRIEDFNIYLRGDGITDESEALQAAHDAAYMDGVREVWITKNYYAPTAYNLGNVLFFGTGQILNNHRKKVSRLSSPRPFIPSGVIPSTHLPRLKAAIAGAVDPKIVIIGDSTSGGANLASQLQFITPFIEQAFTRCNPGVNFTFTNLSIGGSTMSQYADTGNDLISSGLTLPSFFNAPASTWMSYIPSDVDVIIINWGTNNPDVVTGQLLNDIVTDYGAFTNTPDLIFCTPLPRAIKADTGASIASNQDKRDTCSAKIRGFCVGRGYGLIDLNRYAVMLRDGFDPARSIIGKATYPSGAQTLPIVLDETWDAFKLKIGVNNSANSAIGPGDYLGFKIGCDEDNKLIVYNDSGNFAFDCYVGNGARAPGFPYVTSIALPVAVLNLYLYTYGSAVRMQYNTVELIDTIVDRSIGGKFNPEIAYTAGTGPTIPVYEYSNATPQIVFPSMIDDDLFGAVADGVYMGNAINHPSSIGYELVHRPVFDTLNLSVV